MALRYANEVILMDDKKVRQVTIKKAEKAYDEGKNVWLHSCNMRLNNHWQHPCRISKKQTEDNAFTCGSTFKQVVNDYKYYNCDNERGKYPIFFIEVE